MSMMYSKVVKFCKVTAIVIFSLTSLVRSNNILTYNIPRIRQEVSSNSLLSKIELKRHLQRNKRILFWKNI